MTVQKALRIFISYARKDATDVANQLHKCLAEARLESWLDTSHIAAGAVWTKDIEQACSPTSAPGSIRPKCARSSVASAPRHVRMQ